MMAGWCASRVSNLQLAQHVEYPRGESEHLVIPCVGAPKSVFSSGTSLHCLLPPAATMQMRCVLYLRRSEVRTWYLQVARLLLPSVPGLCAVVHVALQCCSYSDENLQADGDSFDDPTA